MVESTVEVHKQKKSKIKFMMNIHEASHVKPLLEKLIAQDPNWKETLMKDYKLKWVSCNIDDQDLI